MPFIFVKLNVWNRLTWNIRIYCVIWIKYISFQMHSCTYGSSIEHSSRRQFVPFPPRSRFHLLEIASQYFYSLYTGKKHTHRIRSYLFIYGKHLALSKHSKKERKKKEMGKKWKDTETWTVPMLDVIVISVRCMYVNVSFVISVAFFVPSSHVVA